MGGLGLGELPTVLWFPYNISATGGASDFKFGVQLMFAKAHHKITHKKGWAWLYARGSSKFGVPLQYLHIG